MGPFADTDKLVAGPETCYVRRTFPPLSKSTRRTFPSWPMLTTRDLKPGMNSAALTPPIAGLCTFLMAPIRTGCIEKDCVWRGSAFRFRSEGRKRRYIASSPSWKPITKFVYSGCTGPLDCGNAAHVAGERASLGRKFTGALPPHLLSWRCIVGGSDEAERSTTPLLDIEMAFGGDGCEGSEGRSSAVGMEYAWTELLNVVVKYSVRESGEKSRRRGSPCIDVNLRSCYNVDMPYSALLQLVLPIPASRRIMQYDNLVVRYSK
jgi:hypothetical protein